jgi:hypothetical protein
MYLMRYLTGGARVRRNVFWLVAAVGGMALLSPVARADTAALSDAEVFTVRNVPVDVTAATAADARRLALVAGQSDALRRMLQRLTRRADHDALPAVDADTTAFLVQGFEVANEKTSSVRYLADLTVRFKAPEVRNLLRQTGLPFAETASRPVLVLPVLRTPDGLVLWDASNRWRTAWALLPVSGGLVPMIVPLGDIADIADIDATQAMLGDAAALDAIAGRYGAGGTLVALATLSAREDGTQLLDVAASQPADPSTPPLLLSFTAKSADEVDEILQIAARETATGVEETWLDRHLLRFENRQSMTLAIPVAGLEQWTAVERKLASIAEISRVELRALRRDSAEVQIDYYGDDSQLAAVLAQHDLELEASMPTTAVPTTLGVPVTAMHAPDPVRVLRSRGN